MVNHLARIDDGEESKYCNEKTTDPNILLVERFKRFACHTFTNSVAYKKEVILATRNVSCGKMNNNTLDNLQSDWSGYIAFTRYLETTNTFFLSA